MTHTTAQLMHNITLVIQPCAQRAIGEFLGGFPKSSARACAALVLATRTMLFHNVE